MNIERGLMLGLTATYVAVAAIHYDLHVLSWIFYFQMMLFGGLLARGVKEMGRDSLIANATGEDLTRPIGHPLPVGEGILAVLTDHVRLRRREAGHDDRTDSDAHRGFHFLAFPIVFSMMGLCSTATIQNLSRLQRLGRCCALIGGLTLEIYLVHGFVHDNRLVATLPFPVNLAAFWPATLLLAWVLSAPRIGPGGCELRDKT